MPVSLKILSHVALIDLENRQGVQGSDLISLTEFLQEYLLSTGPNPNYFNLFTILNEFIEQQIKIDNLNTHPSYDKLNQLSEEFQSKIVQLDIGQSFYMPGGWINRESAGHTILYQWTRNSEKTLELWIYNGGAGLELHEEIADLHSAKYMPVKIYEIPLEKIQHSDLLNFLKKLIEPNISHAPWRNEEFFSYNQGKLYEIIQLNMNLMSAKIIPSRNKISALLAGPGITSGTCSQASIQQFLKVYIGNIYAYKKFMVDYKTYTIAQYLQSNPEPSPTLRNLINKGLTNIQKIVETKDLYDATESDILFAQLEAMKSYLPISKEHYPSEKPIILPQTPQVLEISNTPPMIHNSEPLIITKTSGKKPDIFKSIEEYEKKIDKNKIFQNNINLNYCGYVNKILQDFWEIPFISVREFQGIDSSPLDFYSKAQLYELINRLSNIIKNLNSMNLEKSIEFNTVIWSFLVLLSHAYTKLEVENKIISILFKHILNVYQNKAVLFSNDPQINSRLYAIMQMYPPEEYHLSEEASEQMIEDAPYDIKRLLKDAQEKEHLIEEKRKDPWILQQLYFNFEMLTKYQKIIAQNEDINHFLKKEYDANVQISPSLNIYIDKYSFQSVYQLINNILPQLAVAPIEPVPDYESKESIDELILDIESKLDTLEGLFLPNSIQSIHEHLKDLLHILNHFKKTDTANFNYYMLCNKKTFEIDDTVLDTLKSILSGNIFFNFDKLKWIRKNLYDPDVQANNDLFKIFVLAYRTIISDTKERGMAFSKNILINSINLYLAKHHVLHQNMTFLKRNGLIEIVENLCLQQQFDNSICRAFINKASYSDALYPQILLNKDEILHLNFEILNPQLKDNIYIASNTALKLNALEEWQDVFGRKIYSKNIQQQNSNEIICYTSDKMTRALKLIHNAKELNLILLIDFFYETTNLLNLIHNSDYTEYLLIRLFNSYHINEHSNLIMNRIVQLSQKVYKLSDHQWNSKNEFILRIKCYVICYMYLQNPIEQTRVFQGLKDEIKNLPHSFNQKYCLFYILATEIISGELDIIDDLESINQLLIEHHWVKFNIFGIEERLLEIIENKLSYIFSISTPKAIIFSPRDKFTKYSEALPKKVRESLRLKPDTPCIKKDEHSYQVMSTPSYVIKLDETGEIKSIIKDNKKSYISLDTISNLPTILKIDNPMIWQDLKDPTNIILERNNRPYLRVTQEGLFTLESTPGLLCYGEIDRKIAYFEDLSFVLSYQYPDGTTISHLERYNLSFKQNSQGQIIFLNAPEYHLIEQKYSPFASEVACLVMENEKNERQCIVPIQKFYIDYIDPRNLSPGSYLPIIHDIHQQLQPTQTNENQEYMIFEIDNKYHLPLPKQTKDFLYICYIYMATHEYAKANAILKTIIERNLFTASSEELYLWKMIIHDCPSKQRESNSTNLLNFMFDKGQVSSEECVCRLRAFILIGFWHLQGNPIPDSFNIDIFHLFYQYLVTRKELHSQFLLSETETRALLSLSGNFAYSFLEYSKSQNEMSHLLRLQEATNDTQDRKLIEQRIKNIKTIYKIESEFENHERELEFLSQIIPFNDITLPSKNESLNEKEALKKLDLDISLEELQANFPVYARYFMNHPKERDIQFLNYFLIQNFKTSDISNKVNHRNQIIMLLYLMYLGKKDISYSALEKNTNYQKLWLQFTEKSSRKLVISIPDLKRKKYHYIDDPPLLRNPELYDQLQKHIPKKLPTQSESITTTILERPQVPIEAMMIYHSNFKNQTAEAIARDKFDNREAFKTISETFIETIDIHHEVQVYKKSQVEIQNTLEGIWREALRMANHLDSKTKRKAYILGQFKELNEITLMECYVHQDLNEYMQTCLINEKNAEDLHQLIHNAMHLELENIWIKQYVQLLMSENKDSVAILEHLCKNPSENFAPPLMILQYHLNALLRPNQLKVLDHVMHPTAVSHELISLPMGSGKTKILLPTLANYFANGQQLSLIVVPHSLLESSYQDFKISCYENFYKKVYLFTFERWKNINADNLKIIFEHFESLIINKEILVSSPESIQSLILQYIELLYLDPEIFKDEIYYLGLTIRILQTRTHGLYDEAHHVLSPHTVHNFSLGQKIQLPQKYINWTIDFYDFIHSNHLDSSENIVISLLSDENSPLLSKTSQSLHPYILLYFNHDKTGESYIQNNATYEEKELLAFYKLQFIPQNQENLSLFDKIKEYHLFVDYGPSELEESPLKKNIAIPYESHNKPLENSEFSNHWVTMHCTIQMLYQTGVHEAVFKAFITECLNDIAKQKKITQLLNHLHINFNFLTLEHSSQINKVLVDIKADKTLYQALIKLILQESILSKINIDTTTLSQNSFQHLGSIKKVLAVTGTIGQPLYYSQELKINDELCRGNLEYLTKILEQKNTMLYPCDEKDVISLLTMLHHQGVIQEDFSAIIDINAHFTGMSNVQVAESICQFLSTYKPQKSHVLFFNKNNQLCAMQVSNPKIVTIIGPTSLQEIQKCLPNIQAEDYFAYYDQSHSFGIDIILSPHAFALVLTDEKYDFSQGCTRLRGLEKNQSLSLIVPTDTKAKNIQELAINIEANEKEKLRQSIVPLTMKKCENIIYQQIIRKIIENSRDFQKAKDFLVHVKSIHELYENPALRKNFDTREFLTKYQEELLSEYVKNFGNDKVSELRIKIQEIIGNLPPDIIPEKYSISSLPQMEERTHHLSRQQEQIQQISHTHLQEQGSKIQVSIKLTPIPLELNQQFKSLNTWFSTNIFSGEFLASQALIQSYVGEDLKNLYELKQVFIIQFYYESSTIKAKLICNEEYQALEDDSIWYTSANGLVLKGNPREEWLDSKPYKVLLEQIQFYNGNFIWFEENIKQCMWLSQNTKQKIEFYKSRMMRIRGTYEYQIDDIAHLLIQVNRSSRTTHQFVLSRIKITDKDFLKELEEVFVNPSEAWDVDKHNDYPLKLILLKVVDLRPLKTQWTFSLFSNKSNEQSVIELLTKPDALSIDELTMISNYINSREPQFQTLLTQQFQKLKPPYSSLNTYIQNLKEKNQAETKKHI